MKITLARAIPERLASVTVEAERTRLGAGKPMITDTKGFQKAAKLLSNANLQ